MILRKAKEIDLKRVVEIYNSSIEWRLSTADILPASVQSKREWFNSHTQKRPLLVCEKDGNIKGWVSIEPFHDRPAYANTVEIGIYVDHDNLGKGIGTKILGQVIELLPSLYVKVAIANIFSHNVASLKLFGKYGFKLWGELPEVCEMDGQVYSVSILGLKVSDK